MEFSFVDFQKSLKQGRYSPPQAYRPFMKVNLAKYKALENDHKNNSNDIRNAFYQLKKRVDSDYYWSTYPIQARALDYSRLSFPAYRFILPEVLTDDWLAIVDWHKFQRDHVLHQPMTAYIVQKLLKGCYSEKAFSIANGRTLLEACVDEILKWGNTAFLKEYLIDIGLTNSDPWLDRSDRGKALWRSLFLEAAYLAATFHDIGYPWQYINLLNNKLEHANFQPSRINENAERLLDAFGKRLLFCPLNGYRLLDRSAPSTWPQRIAEITAKALRKTHGLPGAIGFLYLNDVIRDYPIDNTHPIRQFCVEWASMAILMHDMKKIYWGEKTTTPPENYHIRLKFETDPLSCVITLADVLQEFHRPKANFHENTNRTEVKYLTDCNSTNMKLDNSSGVLRIVYCYEDNTQRANKLIWLPADRHEYFDSHYGYLDLSAAGIRRVEIETELINKS